jgi:hypothetical protein
MLLSARPCMQISLTRGLVGVAASRSFLPPPAHDAAVLENGHFSSRLQAAGEALHSSALSAVRWKRQSLNGGLAENISVSRVLLRGA